MSDDIGNPLDAWLNIAACQADTKPFWCFSDRELDYRDFLQKIRKTQAWFMSLGAVAGQRVLLLTEHDQELLALLLGAWSAGLAVAVVNPQATRHEVTQAMTDVEPDYLVSSQRGLFDAAALGPHRVVLEVGAAPARAGFLGKLLKSRPAAPVDRYPALLGGFAPAEQRVTVMAQADALILFSSGTTGRPKGMVLSFAAIRNNIGAITERMGYGPDCRIHNALPLHHVDGLLHGPLLALMCGATIVRGQAFSVVDMEEFVGEMYRRQITHLITVPVILGLILKHAQAFEGLFQWPDFRVAVSTAGPLDDGLWQQVEESLGIRLCNVYGLSETTIAATLSGPDDTSHRHGTVGTPLSGVRIGLRAPDGMPVAAGEAGEVFIHSDALFSRYLKQPEATAEALVDGWMKTGDLGRIDADGRLLIVGRLKNIVIKGGENLNPEEIAARLMSHPGIQQAEVIGLPDARFGETLAAAVVLGDAALSDADILAHCASHLSAAKLPDRIIRFDALPLGPSGKVQRERLKQQCLDRLSQARPGKHAGAPAADIEAAVLRIAEQVFKARPDTLTMGHKPGNTPGWDSLGHLNFLTAIEEKFDFRFSATEMLRMESMRSIVDLTRNKAGTADE